MFVGTEQEEIRVLTKLKETVDKQRNDLRTVKREMKQKTADCDAVNIFNFIIFYLLLLF